MMQEIDETDELCHGNWIEIEKTIQLYPGTAKNP